MKGKAGKCGNVGYDYGKAKMTSRGGKDAVQRPMHNVARMGESRKVQPGDTHGKY